MLISLRSYYSIIQKQGSQIGWHSEIVGLDPLEERKISSEISELDNACGEASMKDANDLMKQR